MIETITERTRDEIEADWHNQGFELIFDEYDDQTWIDKEQEELLFVSWVTCEVKIYKLDRIDSLI